MVENRAKLQKKKNAVRKELAEKGILKREGENTFDRYKYFSEAQYKKLFTELLAKHGIELAFTELDYTMFDGSDKQRNGRLVKVEYSLIDVDTGYSESTVITGEALDKGDKAGYKAYTGSLKYFLANTFLVATGDDPEKDEEENKKQSKPKDKAEMSERKKLSLEVIDLAGKLGMDKNEVATKYKLNANTSANKLEQIRAELSKALGLEVTEE